MGSRAIQSMLAGFEFVESDGIPFVTLDRHRRFYLNVTTRRLIGIKAHMRVALAYNADESSLAIVKPDAVADDVHASVSHYFVDKRYYLSARKFIERYAFPIEQAPFLFVYDRGSSDGSVFIFRLQGQE